MYIHEKGCCTAAALHCTDSPAPVIVSNHISFIDPAFLFYKFLPCVAGNAGLLEVPILSTIFMAITPIAVDRDTAEGRSRAALNCILRPQSSLPVKNEDYERLDANLADLKNQKLPDERRKWLEKKNRIERAALDRQKEVIAGKKPAYPPICIFPEGTTTTCNTLLQFKSGAFLSGQPVQPVVVQYPFCNFEVRRHPYKHMSL
jgi:lysophosphatidylcholine acyltransferase/lyso-PAF acetyltransferase